MTEELKSGLWYRCRDFVTEQSAGEWDDKTIADDADKLMEFVRREQADMLDALRQWKAAESMRDFDELRNAKFSRDVVIAKATGEA